MRNVVNLKSTYEFTLFQAFRTILFKRVLSLANEEAERNSGKVEAFSQAVDEVAFVTRRQMLRAVRENRKSRRASIRLRYIFQFYRQSVDERRRIYRDRLLKPAI